MHCLQWRTGIYLPRGCRMVNSMTYKGTFGSFSSTTGSDLPPSNVLDGDFFVAHSNYTSTVAGKAFFARQWAIFNRIAWDAGPIADGSSGIPPSSIIAWPGATNSIPQDYLPCNGFLLPRADYPLLFQAIGNTYNIGRETDAQFRLPNYNGEQRFLQGNTSARAKINPRLPNIEGRLFDNWQQRRFGSRIGGDGAFKSTVLIANADVKPTKGRNYDSDHNSIFRASDFNAIYGGSNPVQPPAQNLISLIKYQ
jgi:hypothetical protein